MLIDLIVAEASAGFLVGWWMALLMFATFLPWAWLVSSKLDKDAKYFHLNRRMWNGIQMGAGVAAFAAMLLIPIPGINWLSGVILLLGPVLAYWKIRNQQVPESQQYHLSSEGLKEKMQARRAARASREAVIEFSAADGQLHQPPLKDDPLFPIHMLAEDLIGPALEARASRIDLTVSPKGARVMQTIDGVSYKRDPMVAEQGLQLVDYLKRLAGLDVDDRRRRQRGQFHLRGPNGKAAVDVETSGSSQGVVMRLEFNKTARLTKSYDEIGLLPSQREALEVFMDRSQQHGIVLLGAPAAHGLTTTAYAMLGRHDAYTANIKSLEREVERVVEGVDQIEWDPNSSEADFGTNMQSILRRDPDIVLTDIVEDTHTAEVLVAPGMEGPLIYVQQQQSNIVDQIRQWVKIVGDVRKACKPLRAVVNQRLVRKLCSNCRQPYAPSADQLKRLNLPSGKVNQLYRASGKVQIKNNIESCPICGGTGYLGQTGVFEVMIVDDEARKLLTAGDLKAALAHARRNKMIYLQEAALSKVVNGETTIDEVGRVTSPATSADGKSGDGGGAAPKSTPEAKPATAGSGS